jgi:hypothetical protein
MKNLQYKCVSGTLITKSMCNFYYYCDRVLQVTPIKGYYTKKLLLLILPMTRLYNIKSNYEKLTTLM